MNPTEVLRNGAAELTDILGSHGFRFEVTASGSSSGGQFASGEFRRQDRRLELHLRHSLGMVTYHVGSDSLSHDELTRAVRAIENIPETAQYPGFSADPVDGFRHVGADLIRFGRVFTEGTAEEFSALVAWLRQHPKRKGLAGLS
jgi:hypothetical protein